MTNPDSPIQSKSSITEWLIQWIASGMGVPPDEVETDKSLLDYSLSSVTAMMLVGDLEEWLGLTLPPTLVWDFPSIGAIADYLAEQLGAPAPAGSPGVNGAARPGDHTASAADGAMPIDSLDDMSDQEVTALLNQLIAAERSGASV